MRWSIRSVICGGSYESLVDGLRQYRCPLALGMQVIGQRGGGTCFRGSDVRLRSVLEGDPARVCTPAIAGRDQLAGKQRLKKAAPAGVIFLQ